MATRLNLPALESDVAGASADSRSLLKVSRRRAFATVGAAAAGASPAIKTIASHLDDSFHVVQSPGRVVFRLHGRDAWVIDTRHFGGSPRLRLHQSRNLIQVQLKGATFPGTDIAADFTAEIRNGISGWHMSIEMRMARLNVRVQFEPWLEGLERATALALVRDRVLKMGERASVVIGGEATVSFSPDWVVRLLGHDVAAMRGLGRPATSDAASIRLLDRDEPSRLRSPASRRTLITLHRGRREWSIDLPSGPEGSEVNTVDSGFERIEIEANLTRWGRTRTAMTALSDREGDAIIFSPSAQLAGLDGKPFQLGLRNARYAVSFDGPDQQFALVASFSPESSWTHIGGCTIGVGDGEAARPFVLSHLNRRTTLQCFPALLALSVGLTDAVVEPRPPSLPTTLDIAYGRRRRRGEHTAHLTIRWRQGLARHQALIPNLVVSILRPEDLLALRLEYHGFDLAVGVDSPPALVSDGSPGYVVAIFAPQNIAEQAFFEVQASGSPGLPPTDPDHSQHASEKPASPGALAATIAGASRLAFDIPASISSIPYTLASLLDWSTFTQRVAPLALPPGQPPASNASTAIVEPPTDQTSIEAPFRLDISPSVWAYWNHTPDLLAGPGGEVELWHTRLGVRAHDGSAHDDNDPFDAAYRTIRAIWSPDYTTDYNHPPPAYSVSPPYSPWNPYRAGLDAKDRYEIVRSTSDFNSKVTGKAEAYVPSAVQVDRLALSSLGAWIDFRGHWDPQAQGLSLEEWKHRATMARDHYVKVVHAGYLFPFGHKACLVKVTERKFYRTLTAGGSPGPIVAYLFQHLYIQVREPVKTYYGPSDRGAPSPPDYPPIGAWHGGFEGRQMPFKSIRITTLVTPDIEDPATAATNSTIYPYTGGSWHPAPPNHPATVSPDDAFWPRVLINGAGADFLWHCIGTDWDGNTTHFTTPLIYLDQSIAVAGDGPGSNHNNLLHWVLPAYQASSRSTAQMNGQKIALAPSAPPTPTGQGTDPAVATASFTFGAAIPPDSFAIPAAGVNPDQPQYFPTLAVASAEIPAIKHLLGHGAESNIAVADAFLNNAFDGDVNRGEVYLHLVAPDFSSSGKSQQLPLVFGKGDSGQVVSPGPVSPNLSIAGISRSVGPVGAPIQSGVSDFSGIAGGAFNPGDFFGDPAGLLGSGLPKLFGTVSLTDILAPISDFTKYLNKVPGLKVTRTNTDILVHYFWETEQINPWPSGSSASGAIFAPWVIDSDGNNTYPGAGGTGNPVPPMPAASPPPLPDVADAGPGSVDNSGDDPSHVWVATYVIGAAETIGSLGALYDLSQAGAISGDRDIAVTVQQSERADGGINIYRSTVGSAWPLYRVTASTTIPAGQAIGAGTTNYTDATPDSELTNNPRLPSTWCQFGIEMQLTIPLDGSDPTYAITGEVAYASIQLAVLAVPFISLTFIVQSGQKLTVKPQVNEIVFTNELKFVNSLRDFLNAFSDPPFLDVTDTDVTAGFTLSLPNIDVGVFSCQNIAVGAKIIIPYFGDSLAIGFNFCTQDNPFLLICFFFGGGGFFEVDVSPSGLVGLQIGLDAAASTSLDLVVASGEVHAMVGINFDYEQTSGVTLTAIVDIGGSVEVLGIVNMTVDFHLQLTYGVSDNSLTGEAELKLEIPVEFFSIPVTLGPIRKTFAGSSTTSAAIRADRIAGAQRARDLSSDNAVPVGTMIHADTWADYIASFA